MTKSKSTKLMSLLLALVLVTSCFVSGTLARYVTSTSSEDSARVAVWGINDDGVTMDLFDGSYTVNGVLVANSQDGDNIIAPGTQKDNYFSIVNTHATLKPEVMYEIAINLDDSEIDPLILNNPSIVWRLDEGEYGTWEETKAKILALSGDPSGVKTYAPLDVEHEFANGKTHKIGWKWIMDNNNNVMDTEMGNKAATDGDISAKISITITATQVNIDTTGMLNGHNSTYYINDPQILTFRADADYETFDTVKVNDIEISNENYSTEPGSIIVKLNTDYLDTLSLGTHTISIATTDKEINAQFNVVDDKNLIHNDVIPEEATYYTGLTLNSQGYYTKDDFTGATIYNPGDKFPEPKTGDVYIYRDFEYRYNTKYIGYPWQVDETLNGWSVLVRDTTKSSYSSILSTINGQDIVNMDSTFSGCTNLINPPVISEKVKSLINTFAGCTSLRTVPNISNTVENMLGTFGNCTSLTETPVIPSSVKIFEHAFYNCSSLTGTIEINSNNITSYTRALKGSGITNITGSISNELKKKIAAGSDIVLIESGSDSSATGIYYTGITADTVYLGNYTGHAMKYTNGAFPSTPTTGDVYVDGDYEYRYNMRSEPGRWLKNENMNGWGVVVLDKTKTTYGDILSTINGKPVTDMQYTFFSCTALTTAPAIPNSIINMNSTFSGCTSLINAPAIPSSVTNMGNTFGSCKSLTNAPIIPQNVQILSYTFAGCSNLTNVEINTNPTTYNGMLYQSGVTEITGTTTIKDKLLATVSTT